MIATILLGGNIGNRFAYLKFARFHILKDIGTLHSESEVYETEAWGKEAEKNFLNKIIQVHTKLAPQALLEKLLDIEIMAGRKRFKKWGDRTLDLDILFMEDTVYTSDSLVIPHPEIQNRRFTLVPLYEINPDFYHPVLHKKISELVDICTDNLEVKLFKKRGV